MLITAAFPPPAPGAPKTLPAPSGLQQPIRPSNLAVFSGSAWYLDRNENRVLEPGAEAAVWGSPADEPIVGDWNGDGFDELGVFSGGAWFIDRNGDGGFDAASEVKGWGLPGWKAMPGDWNGDGVTDLGVVSPESVWFRDLNGDFAFDPATEIVGWGSPGDTPIVADWNGDGADEIAVYSGGVWFIDYNGDGAFDPATEINGWGVAGWTPLPGDWNGDGKTDLGVVSPDSVWFRDLNDDFAFDPSTEVIGWGSPGDTPLGADWNGDGKTDLGVFSGGVWFVDLNGDGSWQAASEAIVGFGQAGQTPVPGRWGRTPAGAVEFYPEPGFQGVPYSTRVILSLNAPVNPITVNGGSVQLLENGVGIAASRVVSADGRFISVRGTLKPSTDYLVIVSGLRTADDRPIPASSSTFRTGSESSTAPYFYAFPGILDELPPELPIRFAMTVPIDPVSLNSDSFVLENLASGAMTPLPCSLDAGFRAVVCSTGSTLAVGTRFRIVSQGVTSVHGQQLNGYAREFTTGFEPDDGKAPRVLRITPIDGAMQLHPYTHVEIVFDESIEVQSPAPSIRMTRNGVPIEVSYGHRFEQQNILSVSPVQGLPFMEGATYVVTVDEAYDISGRGLANPGVSSTFTIRSGGDGPQSPYVNVQPSGAGLPLNAVFFAEMNQPPQPQTVNTETVRILGPDGELVPIDLTLQSPTMLRIAPQALFSPDTRYEIVIGGGMLDSFGQLFSVNRPFVTGNALDQTAPQVLNVSPPDGAQDVTQPHQVRISFSERVVSPERGFRLERANGDIVAWREGGSTTLQLLEDGQLDPGQQYRIVVEGARDSAGNPLPPFQSTFTTTPAGTAADTTRPTIVASDPVHEAVDVSLTPTITIEFSEPIDPTTAQFVSLGTTVAEPVDVTLLGDGRTLRIIPLQPLKPGRTYYLSVSALDWAGNRCLGCRVQFNTVAGAPDTTPPQILSITPADGSVLDVPYVGAFDVTVVFSEPVEPSTLADNIFVAIDGSRFDARAQLMGDGATAVIPVSTRLSGSTLGIEGDAELTLIVGDGIQDLYGNKLGAERRHLLSLQVGERDDPHGNSQVVDIRPSGQGGAVPQDAIVTLISGVPVSPDGLAERFLVAENGVLKSGVIQLRADDRVVEFVPSSPFEPGAFVQVFLRERLNARDSHNPIELGAFASGVQFFVEGGFEPFRVVAVTPTNSFEGGPATTRPRALLSSPALPSSVNASTVSLQDWTGPVAGTVHLLGGGEIIEFRPAQNLMPNQSYSLTLSGVQSLTGEMLAGHGLQHFTVRADSDTTPPQILAVTPADGATAVPLNNWIRVGFSEQLSRSGRAEDLQLFGMGRSWPIDSVRLDNGPSLSFKPLEALQPNTLYTATFSGGSDPSGLPSGPVTWTFRTGDHVDTEAAKWLPHYDPAVNLTPTSPIRLTFDKLADLVDFAGMALKREGIEDLWTGTWSRSADGMTAIFTPDQPLPVGATLTVPYRRSFSIGFTPDVTPPAIVSSSIPNGATNISPFAQLVVTLSEGLDPRTVNPTTVRLFDGSTQLPLHVELSDKDGAPYQQWEIITAGCTCALELGRTYRGELSGIRDLFGNAIAPYQLTFTTRAVYEFTPPRFTFNLQGQREIFRTVAARIRASEPLNPATVNAQNVFYRIGAQDLPGSVSLEADGKTIRLTPLQPLPAHTEIYVVVTQGVQDAAGNPPEYEYIANFRTGAAEFDVEPPVVAWVQPPDGATGVPVNTIPFIRFSEDLDYFSGYPSYRLLAPGGMEVSTGDGPLLPNTTYTIDVPAVGADFAGLPFAGEQFSFTTGASSVPDLTPPNLTSSNPAQDAVDVPVDTSIELVFNEPVVVTFASVSVDTGYSGPSVPLQIIPGADPTRVNLQLLELLVPSTAYRVHFDGYDLASQRISDGPGPWSIAFQTSSSSPDMTGPRVLTINPPDGATDVAMANAVIEFDEALDPSTVNNGSIRMFVNGESMTEYVGYAGYGSTVHISASNHVPDNSLITVVVSSTLKDLVGNPAEPFVSRFRLGVRQETANPMISAVRPDTGQLNVSPDSSFHLFLTDPIDPTSAQAATLASENGVLISGSVNVTSNNQVITFTPDRPYVDGAEVRLFVDLRVLQLESGGQFGYYLWESWYRVGPPPFQMTSGDLWGVRPRNTRFVMRFSEPLDPSTVSEQSFRVVYYPSGAGVSASVQLEEGGRQVRVTPQQLLDANGLYEIRVDETVRSAGGAALASPINGQFRASDQTASMASMAKLSPPDGVTGVGVNGSILALLADDIDIGTVNEQTLTWTDGVQVYRPSMVRFLQWSGPEQRVASVTPDAPFAPSTAYTVTLAGAEDLAGNPVPDATTTFTTGPAPDLVGPRLLRWAPLDPAAPRNSAITLEFDEPVDPLTIAVGIAAAGNPGPTFTRVISDGGRVITFLPDGLLDPAARYDVALYRSAADLSGNPVAGDPSIRFFTVSDEIIAPPLGVKTALPVAAAANVPIDSHVVIHFDREVRPGSLDPSRIRIEQGGAAIPIRIEITGRGDMIELIPVGLFDPLTPYNWSVDGVVDLAGNALAAPLSGGFSTGAGAAANGPSLVSITPADGATGVGLNAPWVLVFDQPIHLGRSSFSLGPYSNSPDRSSLSADGKTWTISRDEPWPAQSLLQINAYAAGLNGVSASYNASATTGN